MYESLLLTLLVRTGAIIVAGELLRRFCFRCGPTVRHRILLMAATLIAIWPLMAMLIPAISIPMRPFHPLKAVVTVSQTMRVVASPHASAPMHWLLFVWLGGVLLAIAPLAISAVYVGTIRRRAERIHDAGWTTLLQDLCSSLGVRKTPALYRSTRIFAPLTAGVLRAKIFLPAGCELWLDSRRRAVLLHELAHVRRRDVPVQLFVRMVTALWWFQPLTWILPSRLCQESEAACDAAAVGAGMLASEYAAELLGMARESSGQTRGLAMVISMVRPPGLEHRLAAILKPPTLSLSWQRTVVATAMLAAVALAASAMSFGSKDEYNEKGMTMKKTILSGFLAAAGLSAATVSGALTDTTGGAIPNAKVMLYNPDSGAKQEAMSGPDGSFTIQNAPAGDAILRVEKQGFKSTFREFNLKQDSKLERGMVLQIPRVEADALALKRAARMEAIPSEGQRIRVGGMVAQSNLIQKIQPIYPASAKAAHIQGTVQIDAFISKEGVPEELRILDSPNDDLSESALEAVRQWRYSPTLLNGSPVDIETTIVVNYTLSQ